MLDLLRNSFQFKKQTFFSRYSISATLLYLLLHRFSTSELDVKLVFKKRRTCNVYPRALLKLCLPLFTLYFEKSGTTIFKK